MRQGNKLALNFTFVLAVCESLIHENVWAKPFFYGGTG